MAKSSFKVDEIQTTFRTAYDFLRTEGCYYDYAVFVHKTGYDNDFYKQIKNKKYEYKGSKIDNYQPTEEMKTMSNSELLQYQQQKMKKQDDQIDDIIIDVKKGTVLAKETEKILDDQNKQLDELQEDIDKLDSKLKKGAKRFADYAAKKSGYCIVIILVLELIAGILFITLIK